VLAAGVEHCVRAEMCVQIQSRKRKHGGTGSGRPSTAHARQVKQLQHDIHRLEQGHLPGEVAESTTATQSHLLSGTHSAVKYL
jgi:hypothetical protein